MLHIIAAVASVLLACVLFGSLSSVVIASVLLLAVLGVVHVARSTLVAVLLVLVTMLFIAFPVVFFLKTCVEVGSPPHDHCCGSALLILAAPPLQETTRVTSVVSQFVQNNSDLERCARAVCTAAAPRSPPHALALPACCAMSRSCPCTSGCCSAAKHGATRCLRWSWSRSRAT